MRYPLSGDLGRAHNVSTNLVTLPNPLNDPQLIALITSANIASHHTVPGFVDFGSRRALDRLDTEIFENVEQFVYKAGGQRPRICLSPRGLQLHPIDERSHLARDRAQ